MPDFDSAEVREDQKTPRRVAKRGFRRVTMLLRLAEYQVLADMAENQSRTPDQQALHLLRQVLRGITERVAEIEAVSKMPDGEYTAPDMELSLPPER